MKMKLKKWMSKVNFNLIIVYSIINERTITEYLSQHMEDHEFRNPEHFMSSVSVCCAFFFEMMMICPFLQA